MREPSCFVLSLVCVRVCVSVCVCVCLTTRSMSHRFGMDSFSFEDERKKRSVDVLLFGVCRCLSLRDESRGRLALSLSLTV